MIDKKFVIHVVTELMVFIGIIYFVKKKSTENNERITELERKVSILIQEIDNQRQYISMISTCNTQNNQVCQMPLQPLPRKQAVTVHEEKKVNKEVPFEEFVSVSVSDTFEDINDQNIDEEIKEELQELENN